MVQWVRIHWPMQETQIWALVQEDPTCLGATKCVRHNSWSPFAYSLCPETREAPAMRSPWTTAREYLPHDRIESMHSNGDPAQPKIINKKISTHKYLGLSFLWHVHFQWILPSQSRKHFAEYSITRFLWITMCFHMFINLSSTPVFKVLLDV